MTLSASRTARRRKSRKSGAPHRAHPRRHLSDFAAWIGHTRPGAGQSAVRSTKLCMFPRAGRTDRSHIISRHPVLSDRQRISMV